MKRRARMTSLALGLASVIPLSIASATSASAAETCGSVQSITINGGHAEVYECHKPGYVQVRGWVEDTKSDGYCARIYAAYDGYVGIDYSEKACPEGTVHSINFPWRSGTNAYIYLQAIKASS